MRRAAYTSCSREQRPKGENRQARDENAIEGIRNFFDEKSNTQLVMPIRPCNGQNKAPWPNFFTVKPQKYFNRRCRATRWKSLGIGSRSCKDTAAHVIGIRTTGGHPKRTQKPEEKASMLNEAMKQNIYIPERPLPWSPALWRSKEPYATPS